MLTASDLLSGDVVYWTGAAWSRAIDDAALMDEDAAAGALGAAKKQERVVVNAYLVEMAAAATPAHREAMRENIRARGPSVRRDLGKQAQS
jgi:hypothetical protein